MKQIHIYKDTKLTTSDKTQLDKTHKQGQVECAQRIINLYKPMDLDGKHSDVHTILNVVIRLCKEIIKESEAGSGE